MMESLPKSHAKSTQETRLAVPSEWKNKTPRFLFRGWKPSSGGNPELNTTRGVTPHAFYGSDQEPHHKSIFEIPEQQIKSEIEGHLRGSLVRSHFSSWAANFQTALQYAGVGKDAHIAVFDTSLQGEHNMVYHVSALQAMRLASYYYPEEYLVYGPVAGRAYTCVSVMELRNHGMHMTEGILKGTPQIAPKDLAHASKIAKIFKVHNHGVSRDLFLTLFAAELSRTLRSAQCYGHNSGWSQADNKAILRHLSVTLKDAAESPHNECLVNPRTYVHGFPQLRAMIDILMTVELEISRKKSKISEGLPSATSSSSALGRKRKADDMHGSIELNEFKLALQEKLPQDLLQDLAKHGRTFQAKLREAQKSLFSIDSFDEQAYPLLRKLSATEIELESLIIVP